MKQPMFSGSSAPQKNSQLQQRLDTLSSRVGQLLADCDRRIQPTTTELHSLQLPRRQNHRRGQHHIAREVQQVRDGRMSNRADIRREELQSMLQRQSRTETTTTTTLQSMLQRQSRTETETTTTTLRQTRTPHQTVSTHIDLTRTIPIARVTAQRTELRAWLADVLESNSEKTNGLLPEQLEMLVSSTLSLSLDVACCICLEQLDAGHVVTNLPCTHKFHTTCIRKWLQRSRCCPLCISTINIPSI